MNCVIFTHTKEKPVSSLSQDLDQSHIMGQSVAPKDAQVRINEKGERKLQDIPGNVNIQWKIYSLRQLEKNG